MKTLIKNAREKKGLKTRELAHLMGIDQALISKFEAGTRKPTKEQVAKIASLLDIDYETLMVAWLKEKILYEIGQDEFALKWTSPIITPGVSVDLRDALNASQILPPHIADRFSLPPADISLLQICQWRWYVLPCQLACYIDCCITIALTCYKC